VADAGIRPRLRAARDKLSIMLQIVLKGGAWRRLRKGDPPVAMVATEKRLARAGAVRVIRTANIKSG